MSQRRSVASASRRGVGASGALSIRRMCDFCLDADASPNPHMPPDVKGTAPPDRSAAEVLAADGYSAAGEFEGYENDPETDELLEAEWRFHGYDRDEWQPERAPKLAPVLLLPPLRLRAVRRPREPRRRRTTRRASARAAPSSEPDPPPAAPLATGAASARLGVGA
jgi:hypothetical protein